MGENQKMSDDNINLSQVEQDMCPAQPCCTLVSYSFFSYHIHFAPSYKTCIHCKNMCACSSETQPTILDKAFFGSEADRASGDFCSAENRDLRIFRNSRFQFGTSGPDSFHQASYQQNWELYLTHKSRQMEKIDIDLLTLQIRETKALIWRSEQNCHM